MAKIIENKKCFKVIECSLAECIEFGGLGICDHCNSKSDIGYYVAVINSWICKECYDKFMLRAVRYNEDIAIENKYFEIYKKLLNVQ